MRCGALASTSIQSLRSKIFPIFVRPLGTYHGSSVPYDNMTHPVDIQGSVNPQRAVSRNLDQNTVSTSPTTTIASPPGSWGGALAPRGAPKQLKPFNTQDIKILLLENVNAAGQEILKGQGYQVEALKTSLPEDQLIEKIRYT